VISAAPTRTGSAMISIAAIVSPVILNTNATRGVPPGAQTAPSSPSTSADCANRARPENVSATAAAPHYDERALAGLIVAIANINVWNRLNVTVCQPAGEWKG
jgi:hypothetical protein